MTSSYVPVTTVGASGLRVSRIGVGCSRFGTDLAEDDARAIVDAAFDAGITFFDTADSYGGGASERVLGRALAGRRDESVVATKFRHAGPVPGAGRKSVRVAVDNSLRRLGCEYIDLYQVHAPDPATPVEETLDALQDLVRQGKILYYGLCNVRSWQVVEAQLLARAMGGPPLTAVQAQLNLVERARLDDLGQVAKRYGVGLLAASPLARGLLGGSYDRDTPPPRAHPLLTRKGVGYWGTSGLDTLERVREVAAALGQSPARTALGALLARAEGAVALIGGSSAAQVRDAAGTDPAALADSDVRYLFGQSDRR
ncbi:aldo/keto reductase [Streptomyces sp. WZ.A104]|uniref:aldo/keto reductase n=1 Tax=Streptomyces sp. WZ.A104 TaxID=2023771 RepID=UPI0015CCF0F1|nr:aldo/keto reductase [Streptomyces sp. WZ.A104]